MTRKERYSKENFEKAIKESKTIKDALKKMGLRAAGGNYKVFYKYVEKYGIDTSHFETKEEIAKRTIGKYISGIKIPLSDILVENSTYSRTELKKRLYDEGLKERKCEIPGCGQGEEWMGNKMSLILDHKNGIHNDNRIENLRIVCPNCNATLPTHCGKHKKKINKCLDCGDVITSQSKKCQKCSATDRVYLSRRKVKTRPPYEQLQQEIKDLGYSATGRKYGVSDNAIRKWVKSYEKYGE